MKYLNFNYICRFNQTCRDLWVAEQASIVPPGSKVLDVGAGPCRYRERFAHCYYHAHDFAQLSSHYGKLDYVSDILEIPVADASFDCILCTEVLEHVPEPIKAVHEIARILRPGGRLILTAPLGCGVHQEPYFFYGGYSSFWYTKFLTEAGFTDVKVESNAGFFRFYGQESGRFATLLFKAAGVRWWLRLILFPLLIVLKLLFGGFMPLVCCWLDKLYFYPRFTVGYHVTAIRNPESGAG